MKLSKTEVQILRMIALGNKDVSEIAKALKKSKSQIYRSGKKLAEKGLVVLSDGAYEPVKVTHVNLFLQIIRRLGSPEPFSGAGIPILETLLEPKTIKEIIQETGIKRTQVFKQIRIAKERSIVKKEKGKYFLNLKLYPDMVEFLGELKKYESFTDPRVPADAVIYFKTKKEIVFSSGENLDATPTAFSAYKDYGIKLLNITNFFYLPKRKLGKKEVFRHSLYVAEKRLEIHYIIYVSLFYAKYKKGLSRVKHKILDNLNWVFKGQRIPGYPTLQEIKERADMYDIQL